MEKITDWIKLWRQIVEARPNSHGAKTPGSADAWYDRARSYHQKVLERWAQPDSSREFLLKEVNANTTVLDVGAGTGSWTLLLAPRAAHVTAVDPSPAMLEMLQENVSNAGLNNVSLVQAAWPEAQVEPHDLTLCAHAMYGCADLPRFIHALMAATRKRCYLLMRAPVPDNVMSLVAQRVWGQPHDSPNFVICYNALLQMGIYANVLMENTGAWGAWTSESLEAAFDEVKSKLGLSGPSEHDDFIREVLAERLIQREDGQYVWPPSMRSALVYWDVS